LRLLLIWDNLAGHTSWAMVRWLFQQGVMPLYTPLSGSWLNIAGGPPPNRVGGAPAGQDPHRAAETNAGPEGPAGGRRACPQPFVWDGKRRERRRRARQRRLGGSPARLDQSHSIAA